MWAIICLWLFSLQVFLAATNHQIIVLGCSEVPFQRIGPFFNPFVGRRPVPQSLKTTLADPSLLLGSLSVWEDNGDEQQQQQQVRDLNITIDIASGNVRMGWPEGVVPTELPVPLADPSGGYELRVLQVVNNGLYVALGQQQPPTNSSSPSSNGNGTSTATTLPMLIELLMPTGFVIDDPPQQNVYFMVDDNLALIFYPGSIDCLTNPTYASCAALACRPEEVAECFWAENFATVVDWTQRRIVRHQSFNTSRGVDVSNPGPSNSLRTVWPTLGILNLGYSDSCGGTGYLAYNETGVIGEADNFDPGLLSALAVDRSQEAYIVQEQTVSVGEQLLYVAAFQIQRINLVTGETLDSFPLNATALWLLSNVPFPGPIIPTPTATLATTAPPVSNVPGAPVAIVVSTKSPVMTPTTTTGDQTTTRAPFPTVFIPWLPPRTPSSASPTAKVWGGSTNRPSSPTSLLGSTAPPTPAAAPRPILPTTITTTNPFPQQPTSAPFPTILIVWPPPAFSETATTVAPTTDEQSPTVTPTPTADIIDDTTTAIPVSPVPILTVSNFTIRSKVNRDELTSDGGRPLRPFRLATTTLLLLLIAVSLRY
jgi:hypothetical protein